MKRIFYLVAGCLSLSLGVLGIFLPVLPTTPFLLLAAGCFLKSSKKLYHWLVDHPVLGLYIRSFLKYKAITIYAKVISLVALWLVILSTIVFFVDALWLRVLLGMVAIGVSVYLLSMKTLTPELKYQLDKAMVEE